MNLTRRFTLPALAALLVAAPTVYAAEQWNLSAEQPDGNYITATARAFAADVAKATNGELEIRVHSNSVLFKRPEVRRAVQTGQIQAGDMLISFLGNEDPVFEVDAVPLVARDFDAAWKLWEASRAKIEERLDKSGVKLLYSVPWPPQSIYTKMPVNSMDDMKGKKFRSYNAQTARLVELMGAVPTTINTGDVPQAFGTGMIEAMITSPATGVDTQAWDFSEYYYDVKAFIPKNVLLVNKRSFNRLSPESQKAVLEAAERAEKHGWEQAREQTQQLVDTLAKNGMKVGPAPESVEAELAKIGETMASEWIKRAGADGKAILDQIER